MFAIAMNGSPRKESEPMDRQTGKPGKLIRAATAARAISTVAVVVVPLAAATAAMLGYGAYAILKKLKRKNITGQTP